MLHVWLALCFGKAQFKVTVKSSHGFPMSMEPLLLFEMELKWGLIYSRLTWKALCSRENLELFS